VWDAVFWTYFATAVLVIAHEIDSAYWREWELFGLPGGAGGFVLLHLPLLVLVLGGLVLVRGETLGGLVISLLLSLGGVGAFAIHAAFMRRGHRQFTTFASLLVLLLTLPVAVAQLALTIVLLAR
jgi:hypothetical protein